MTSGQAETRRQETRYGLVHELIKFPMRFLYHSVAAVVSRQRVDLEDVNPLYVDMTKEEEEKALEELRDKYVRQWFAVLIPFK